MRGLILKGMSLFCMLAFVGLLYGEDTYNIFEHIKFCRNDNLRCELSWDENVEPNASKVSYHLYEANCRQDLLPSISSETFLGTPQAFKTYVGSSEEAFFEFEGSPRYIRLIGLKDNITFDVAELIALESLEKRSKDEVTTKGKSHNNHISKKIKKLVSPYLLPTSHPIKPIVDQLCAGNRIVASEEALKQAGFEIIYQQLNHGLLVVKHSRLRGYLLKLYLDTSPRVEWNLWVLRASGARKIQSILDKYRFNSYMKVPKKWIYQIHAQGRPIPSENIFPKDFILIVEDMNLVSKNFNQHRYKNKVTYKHLDALYKTIDEGGLSDSHLDNIPFSKDNKIAFIDTEYVNSWPVHLDWLTKEFSIQNQRYWLKLMQKGEAKKVK